MVLNFFQLRNHTKFNFQLINSENNSDNYNVGPWDTTSRGDMWLAQGEGAKGVGVLTFADGSATSPLLYMWDQNWSLRYRIGGETTTNAIAVDSNKDFSIDVYDETLTLVCYNGSFNSSDGATVTLTEWKDRITNHFSDLISDAETVEYAKKFAADDENAQELFAADRVRLIKKLAIPTAAQYRAITDLVGLWDFDYLEANRGQTTLFPRRGQAAPAGWRIDLQDNGAVERNGMHFYNIAVQYGSGRDNVYAHVMLPVGYLIGRRRIRNALLLSATNHVVQVIIPPRPRLAFIQGIPYRSDQARTSWAVRSVQWECTDTSSGAWQ